MIKRKKKTKDRLKYISNPGILPQKCVGEYMKKLSQHLLDPTTEIKVGRLNGNESTKSWKVKKALYIKKIE